MYSDNKYVKQREKLVEKALKLTFEYCTDIDGCDNKDLFNRVFLNTMDKLCYEKGISHIKPRKMSHETKPDTSIEDLKDPNFMTYPEEQIPKELLKENTKQCQLAA